MNWYVRSWILNLSAVISFKKKISLQLTVLTALNIYPPEGNDSPECDLGFGLGQKFYLYQFYLGTSFVFKKYNDLPDRNVLLIESGYLVRLNQKIFLDLGLDYAHGISTTNQQLSNIKFEVGVATFL